MSLALVVATIDRPHVIQRLVRSVRARFPDMSVYVADQSHPTPHMREFYADSGVNVSWVAYDSGVAASRNEAVARVKEDYFVLCDDDFILTEETRFDDALRVLAAGADIGVVGGRLKNVTTTADWIEEIDVHWELFFDHDRDRGHLVTIPVHLLSPEPEDIGGVRVFPCDSVLNFAVFRRSMFSERIGWDPQFKSNGEHEDFYLNLKHHGKHRPCYLPTMVAEHHHPPLSTYETKRHRQSGWALFMKKWNLRQHLELGYGTRSARDVDDFAPIADLGYTSATLNAMHRARHRYFFGRNPPPFTRPLFRRHTPADVPNDLMTLFFHYLPEHRIGEDFIVFLMPWTDVGPGRGRPGDMFYAWRKQNICLIQGAALTLHRAPLVWNEWTAFSIPVPEASGLLTLDFMAPGADGAVLHLASGDVVVRDRHASDTGLASSWVLGWSRARARLRLGLPNTAEEPVDDVDIWTRLVGSIDGADLALMTVRNGGRQRRLIHFPRFPYDFGGGRAFCEIPPGPDSDYVLLLPSRLGTSVGSAAEAAVASGRDADV